MPAITAHPINNNTRVPGSGTLARKPEIDTGERAAGTQKCRLPLVEIVEIDDAVAHEVAFGARVDRHAEVGANRLEIGEIDDAVAVDITQHRRGPTSMSRSNVAPGITSTLSMANVPTSLVVELPMPNRSNGR